MGSREQETPPRRRRGCKQLVLQKVSSHVRSRSSRERVSPQKVSRNRSGDGMVRAIGMWTRPRNHVLSGAEAVTCCRELARTLQLSLSPLTLTNLDDRNERPAVTRLTFLVGRPSSHLHACLHAEGSTLKIGIPNDTTANEEQVTDLRISVCEPTYAFNRQNTKHGVTTSCSAALGYVSAVR